MKKILILIVALVAVVSVGMIAGQQFSATVDFRGEVTAIEQSGDYLKFSVRGIGNTAYTVLADSKTHVSYCHPEDGAIRLEEIRVGDTVQGSYKPRAAEEQYAKEIEVFHR